MGLVAVLSLGASVFLNASLTENLRAERLVSQSTVDLALEAAFHERLAEALNTPQDFALGERDLLLDEFELVTTTTDEQARPDLLRDDIAALTTELDARLGRDDITSKLNEVRSRSDNVRHLPELSEALELSLQLTRCLEEHFTLYRSTLNPLGRRNRTSLDGAILRFKIATKSGITPTRTLRAIVLITGDRQTPYHIMDWSYGQDTTVPTCPPV